VANLYTGQVLFQKPRIAHFKKLAEEQHFAIDPYLDELEELPILNEARLRSSLEFLSNALTQFAEQSIKDKELLLAQRKSKDNELFLDSIIDQSPFATWISDSNGTIIKANSALKEQLNLTDEQLLGKYNILEDGNIWNNNLLDQVKSVYQKGKTIEIELFWQREKNNKIDLNTAQDLIIQANIFPIFDSEGRITNAVCHWMDISKRRETERSLALYQKNLEQLVEQRTQKLEAEIAKRIQIEKDLRKNQTIFDAFLENNPIFVFFKDKDIRAVKLSRNYEKMLGMPLKDLIGKTMDDLFPSDLAKAMIEDDKKILFEEKLLHVEEQMDGHYYETVKFPIYIEGKAELLAGFTMDITQRKEAEIKLKEANAQTLAIIDNTSDSIWAINNLYEIIYINRVFKAEYKESFDIELEVGMNLLKALPQSIRHRWQERYDRVLANEAYHLEDKIDEGGGQVIYIQISANPIIVSGEVIGASFFGSNITEKKQAEEQLRQTQKMKSMGQLAGGVAQNFNNMLSGIIGCTEILQGHLKEDKESLNYLDMILESSERAADLAKKLLTFSRPQELKMSKIFLHDIIISTQALLNNTVDKRIYIELNLSAQKDSIMGDTSQLQSVLLNLGINATQAMDQSGRLSFKTKNQSLDLETCQNSSFNLQPGNYITIEVSDTGSGIPTEYIERIFDPFFTTKDQGKGTGLGLSTTLGTVQQHQGSIEVESSPGAGTVFTLMFPLSPEE
jgi:PAS domain S-box-containing protein